MQSQEYIFNNGVHSLKRLAASDARTYLSKGVWFKNGKSVNSLIDSIESGVCRYGVNSCDHDRLRVETLHHERKARGPKLDKENKHDINT